MNFSRAVFILCIVIVLQSCSKEKQKNNIDLVIQKTNFDIRIPGVGELEAAKSTNISMPSSVFETLVIEWLAEENTYVKKGEAVVRFDAIKFKHLSGQEQFQIDKSIIGYRTKQKILNNEQGEIKSEKKLVVEELDIADHYSIDDLQVYSRNEIIDAMRNKKYLEAKWDYTNWREISHDEKSQSELELLRLIQGQHTAKFDMYNSTLKQLEIKAPHDGLFVLNKNWRGEKSRVGDAVWPGSKIAKLPDLTKLQAKIYVLESEAAGLKLGQRVDLTLDAYPEQKFNGEIAQIDSIAKPRENDSPVKYFEVIVSIDVNNKDYWRPGNQLQATIIVAELKQVISIPSQSLFMQAGKFYVRMAEGDEGIDREVKIGKRNMAKTQIVDGLEVGEKILLLGNGNTRNAIL